MRALAIRFLIPRLGLAWAGLLALAKIALLLLASSQSYGYFRDEFYFLDASRHLALGYVDFPPLVALIGAGVRAVLGTSPLALRVLPAIAGALVILLAALMARALGAGAFGQALAALACLVAPMLLAVDSFFSMNPFDQLWWALLAFLAIQLLQQDRPRLWLLCGAVMGLGLLTKESMLALGLGLVAGLALSPARRFLRRGRFGLAVLLALALAAPYLFWQAANGWPTLAFWQGYRSELVHQSLAGFVLQQIMGMNPATLLLSVAGIYFYLVSAAGKPYRALGWSFVILAAGLALAGAKTYFLAPLYPMLFAGGATLLERISANSLARRARPVYAFMLLAVGLFLLPVSLPILPPATLAQAYAPAMAFPAIHVETSQSGLLPEWLAGRLGWEQMVAAVHDVYAALPPDEQQQACVLAGDYGEAGALNFYGAAYGVPPAISGHNNYFLWGPGVCSGQVIIAVGVTPHKLESLFGSVVEARRLTCAECMPGETDVPIDICRQPRRPLREAWPEFKCFGMSCGADSPIRSAPTATLTP